MTRIERTECPEHGAARMIGGRCHVMAEPYVLCKREGVTVEYVPAEQLRGAVEALRDLLAVATYDQSPTTNSALHTVAKQARDVLDRVGEREA